MRLLCVGVLVLLSLVAEFATAQKCRGQPDAPEFSTMRCFKKRNACRATCEAGYIFSEKNSKMAVYDCIVGEWVMKGGGEDKCTPECDPPCENGVCIKPNTCECEQGFYGDYCEEEEDYGSYSYSSEEVDEPTDSEPSESTPVVDSYESYESTDSTPVVNQDVNWSPIRDACIEGHNYKTFSGVLSIDLCKENCVSELGNNCGSIDYEPDSGKCFISEATSDSDDYTEPCFDGVVTKFTEIIQENTDVNWSQIRDACIEGHNYITFNGVLSIGLCKEHCLFELGNNCGSIDYEPDSGKCFISEARSDSDNYTEPCFDGVLTKFTELLVTTGVNWSPIKDACIQGHNYKTLDGVLSIGLCKEHCVSELGIACGSIDYEPDSGKCFISDARSDSYDYTEPCFDGIVTKFTEILLQDTTDVNWSQIRDACIEENNYKTLDGVLSIGLCKEHCLFELGNDCGSIDYEPESGKCFISEATSGSDDYTEPCFDGVLTKFTEILNWSPIRDACIKENNYKTLSGVLSIGLCKEHCVSELGNDCGSIDYEPNSGNCFISEATSGSDDYTEPCFDGVLTKFTEILHDTTGAVVASGRQTNITGGILVGAMMLSVFAAGTHYFIKRQ